MAQKVLYLLKNPDRAKEMGERGRAQVKEFDSHTMVKQQEVLYFSLLA
jgi:glycosyltransferase involved in cell wall biosynthesis